MEWVPAGGVEPLTVALRVHCSAIELRGHSHGRQLVEPFSGPEDYLPFGTMIIAYCANLVKCSVLNAHSPPFGGRMLLSRQWTAALSVFGRALVAPPSRRR